MREDASEGGHRAEERGRAGESSSARAEANKTGLLMVECTEEGKQRAAEEAERDEPEQEEYLLWFRDIDCNTTYYRKICDICPEDGCKPIYEEAQQIYFV